jgi:multidrug efflux system membrane fusion protein
VAAGAGALIALAFWYFMAGSNTAGTNLRSAAAPVRVATVIRRDMPVVQHALGTVVANTLVQVTARVQGVLDTATFKEGQFVKKGDLLFRIDPRAFQSELDQARGVLLRDEALLKNGIIDKQRYRKLYEQRAISDQMRDTSATNADVFAATVAIDRAAVKNALLNLGYTQIRSPVDGKTGLLLVQPGNMVAANNTTPLVMIAEIQPVKVSFNLPQSDLGLIQARQHAQRLAVVLDSKDASGKPLAAPVDFVSNAVSNQSGTIELRATFDNAELSLVPGQLVNVIVELDNLRNALVVPRNAINDGPKGPYVYVVTNGKAVEHGVKILFDDTKNAAIKSDVKPGDMVISEGQLRVEPGGAVRVIPLASGSGAGRGGGSKSKQKAGSAK